MDGFDRETVDSLGTTVDDINAIGQLLDSPRLAHIWFTLHIEGTISVEESDVNPFLWDGFSVSELLEYLSGEIPQSTLYSDMEELKDIGAIRVKSEDQPKGYSAKFFQVEAENVEMIGDTGLVGPGIIGVVGEAYRDEAVQEFLDTYSHGLLYEAYEMYVASLRGAIDMRFVEMLPEVGEDDLEAIVPAIERVLFQMTRNPNWEGDHLFDLSELDKPESNS